MKLSVVIVAFSNTPEVLLNFKSWLLDAPDTVTSDKSLRAAAAAAPPILIADKLLCIPPVNILASAATVKFVATPFTIRAPKYIA